MNSSLTRFADAHHPLPEGEGRVRARHRSERNFRRMGVATLAVSLLFLTTLLCSIIGKGYGAFIETTITLTVDVPAANVDYDKALKDALLKKFPGITDRRDRLKLYRFLSQSAPIELEKSGRRGIVTMPFRASSRVDMWHKGKVDVSLPEDRRNIKDKELAWLNTLNAGGAIGSRFNGVLFSAGDSREPEQAGFIGSVVGSLFTILVCMLIALPIGVAAASYLEEFAPKNRLTDIIEININNLAAVPSIVFGLLGLAVYLNLFGLPRGSALVGGATLALLVLPTIVITTRSALKSVPPSIRTAALGLGATPMQVLLHHTLPLAMPGIMTGTILSIARALGETAPLLMIGMVAFVVDIPRHMLEPSTAMPVQIYLWSSSPELGFAERTSAGIIILLLFLICANGIAVYLRRKFEVKW